MTTYSKYAPDRHWRCGVFVSMFIALTAWTSAWPWKPPGEVLPVVVHEGQLSVDLHEASVREVLAAIAQQAGVRVHVDDSANRIINAQFTDLALDQGLRRLLRAASLNFSLLYARDSDASDTLREVHVFGEAGGQEVPSHDRPRLARVSRAAAVQNPPPQEEPAEVEPPSERGPDAEPESAEPEPDDEALLE